jgi:hypothetical protein
MRKLLVISVTAHADPSFQVAANDQPLAPPAETKTEPAKDSEPAKAAEPAPAAETKPVLPSKPKQRAARRESDEQTARRIAAKYGVYW